LEEPAVVEEGGSESGEDEVEEEIDIEDLWEVLGGGRMEPVRSQVRNESSEGGSSGRERHRFGGVLSLARRI
jgi:hypothetical protein